MTVAGAASPTGSAASRWGSRERAKARPRAGGAGRDRRPGGVSQGAARLRRRRRATATLVGGAEAIGVPIVVTEQYPRAWAARPEVAERLPEGSSRSRRSASRPPRPRASTSAVAIRRSSAGSRPTSASTRPSSTCSTRTSRSTWPPTRSARARGEPPLGLAKAERAGAVLTSVETALFELLGRAGADEFKRVQKLVLDTRRTRERRVRPARGRHPPRRRAGRERRRDHRRGRLQHLDDRLPGGGHRPLLRGPDHHLHLSR